jgi:hypothetical protein
MGVAIGGDVALRRCRGVSRFLGGDRRDADPPLRLRLERAPRSGVLFEDVRVPVTTLLAEAGGGS